MENEVVLLKIKEKRNTKHTIKLRNANCIDHILRRNYHLTHTVDENIEKTER